MTLGQVGRCACQLARDCLRKSYPIDSRSTPSVAWSRRSQRDVAVLLRRQRLPLGAQRPQRLGDGDAGLGRGGSPRPRSRVRPRCRGWRGCPRTRSCAAPAAASGSSAAASSRRYRMLTAPCGAHDRDLRGRPGEVDVAAEVLGAHDVVGAAVGLAGDHGDLRDGRLGVGVDQLGAAADDAAPTPGRRRAGSRARRRSVRTGTLNASQVRTKRAAFSEASMSRQPAKCIGWLATTPTGAPLDPAEADEDVRRERLRGSRGTRRRRGRSR